VKVGELYTLSSRGQHLTFNEWKGKVALYLGESVINRSDGVTIINHAFIVNGERRITDRSFLKMLNPLTPS
jgi:hypothetical protein